MFACRRRFFPIAVSTTGRMPRGASGAAVQNYAGALSTHPTRGTRYRFAPFRITCRPRCRCRPPTALDELPPKGRSEMSCVNVLCQRGRPPLHSLHCCLGPAYGLPWAIRRRTSAIWMNIHSLEREGVYRAKRSAGFRAAAAVPPALPPQGGNWRTISDLDRYIHSARRRGNCPPARCSAISRAMLPPRPVPLDSTSHHLDLDG